MTMSLKRIYDLRSLDVGITSIYPQSGLYILRDNKFQNHQEIVADIEI